MAWPEKAFASEVAADAMTKLFGTDQSRPEAELIPSLYLADCCHLALSHL